MRAPFELHQWRGVEPYTEQVTATFSLKELSSHCARNLPAFVVERLGEHIEQAIFHELMQPGFVEKLVKEVIREEVRKKLKDELDARVEDFIDEVVG